MKNASFSRSRGAGDRDTPTRAAGEHNRAGNRGSTRDEAKSAIQVRRDEHSGRYGVGIHAGCQDQSDGNREQQCSMQRKGTVALRTHTGTYRLHRSPASVLDIRRSESFGCLSGHVYTEIDSPIL